MDQGVSFSTVKESGGLWTISKTRHVGSYL